MLQLPPLNWQTSPNFSSRGGSKVRLFVLHDCEGSYNGSIGWFAQTRSKVSAHTVLSADGQRATQMVDWRNKAWHACNANPYSESLEMEGFAKNGFSSQQWLAAAAIVAYRLKVNGIPPVWAVAGIGTGFCSHYDLGAFGGGHSDPTTDHSTWLAFVRMVQDAYALPMPSAWAPSGAPVLQAPASDWKPCATTRHDLDEGSLEWVQMELNALGIPVVPLKVDGMMGLNTEAAIAKFQQKVGIHIDGDPGPDTIAHLKSASACTPEK